MANLLTKRFAARRKKVTNPRKATVGTSYTASGVKSAAGTRPQTGDEQGSSQPVRIREVVPELASAYVKLQTYSKMMTDSSVDVSMRAAKTPVLGADFFVEPFSDDPLDLEVAEFITANLMEGMSAPFLNALEDILHLFEDGYSVLEKVHESREWAPRRTRSAANTKQFIMLQKLAVRPASTVAEIVYDDNGGPEGVKHNAIKADGSVEEKEIDIGKILLFSFNKNGGDLTGKSLLRTAYSHWYYKTHFYKIDAIQKERFSLGILKGRLLPGWTNQDRTILRTLLRNYRTNEEAFMILTPAVEVDVEFPSGTPVDVLDSAVHHNGMILMNVLGQFITMGSEGGSSGGRATAGTQSDLFMKSLRYVANYIAEQINMYVIPELVVWNYPTMNFPRLAVRNMGETRDLQMLASALGNLFSQEAITWTPETELWIRKIFDMPSVPVETLRAAVAEKAAELARSSESGSGNGNGETKLTKEQVAQAKTSAKGKPLGERTGNVGKPTNAAE